LEKTVPSCGVRDGLSPKPNISTEVSTVCRVDSQTVCKSHRSRIRAAGCGG
jgi:hypothetical protein